MRVTVDGRDVEGTAAEVAEFLSLLGKEGGKTEHSSGKGKASPFVSEAVAREVLTRRELGNSHNKLLTVLRDAGDEWTGAPELQTAMGLSTREFAGVLGALGRRVTHTEGAGGRNFLDQYWDSENGHNLYRLPPSVRAAFEAVHEESSE